MEKEIIYSGFDQAREGFVSSTPDRRRFRKRTSFSTSQESRGYGTMKSVMVPKRRSVSRRLDAELVKVNSSSSDEPLIAPPCSVNHSFDESLDSELGQLSDYEPGSYDTVFTNGKSTALSSHDFQCSLCHQTFFTHLELMSHQEKHLLPTTPVSKPRCSKCNKRFKCKTKLKMHQDKVHPADMVVLMVL